MKYDAVQVAEAENRLVEHSRACNRCFQGIHCPEKERIQAAIEQLKNGWKHDWGKPDMPAGQNLADEVDSIVKSLENRKGVKEETMDGDVYEGDDRIRQVCYLQNLAANISFGSNDASVPARDRVNYYCANFPDELPTWFDDGDKELLITLVGDDDEDDVDYDPVWDSPSLSAAAYGGGDWRTCSHGYLRGECPTCDKEER